MNRYSRRHNDKVIRVVCITALMIGTTVALGHSLIRAIDIKITNQDRMLCKSAQISGNTDYLKKCECFYKTDDITCLQK
ncbi:MAG: hypothetical protein PHW73_10870 [Atribacterota bacterium]|nr:hypothetical protein [Atribacterota bacterium]